MTIKELRQALRGKKGSVDIVIAKRGEVFSFEIKNVKECTQHCVNAKSKQVVVLFT